VTRRTATLTALGGLLAITLVCAVWVGSVALPFATVAAALLDGVPGLGWGGASPQEAAIVLQLRLPRVLLAGVVGGSLAISGTALQGLFRNPMADPGIIGVSSGAAFGGVAAVIGGWAFRQPWTLPAFAFLGATAATWTIYALATRHGRTTLAALLLGGLAVSAFVTAMTSFLLSLAPNVLVLRELVFWLLGSLDGRGWPHLRLVIAPALLGSALLLAFARDLNVMAAAGEEGATSLGLDVQWLKRSLLVVTALVTGTVVSVSGTIGFVGLLVPHAVRLVTGPDHRLLLPASFLGGAVFLIWADLLARALSAQELPLGVVTAAVGAPVFVLLLQRYRGRVEAV
jgi:iron complex transport system permease protein